VSENSGTVDQASPRTVYPGTYHPARSGIDHDECAGCVWIVLDYLPLMAGTLLAVGVNFDIEALPGLGIDPGNIGAVQAGDLPAGVLRLIDPHVGPAQALQLLDDSLDVSFVELVGRGPAVGKRSRISDFQFAFDFLGLSQGEDGMVTSAERTGDELKCACRSHGEKCRVELARPLRLYSLGEPGSRGKSRNRTVESGTPASAIVFAD